MTKVNRRKLFLRCSRLIAVSAAGAALNACGATPKPTQPAPTDTPAAVVPTATTLPTQAVAEAATSAPTVPAATPTPPAATPTSAAVGATATPPGTAYLAVVHGSSPAAITEAAIKAIGGIERFVKPGDDVIVKPNICVAYHGPEYAATTNPEVVATIVRLCRNAGAKRVRVMDYPFGGAAKEAYVRSGIQEAVEAAGGEMELMSHVKYAEVEFPAESVDIRKWVVYQDALKADVIINVPIAKHHGNATLTLGAKNLMGLIENRNLIHVNLHQRIADLITLFKPKLTVVDAVRILMANGPSGGDLSDVKEMNTVIASHDIVAADAYATTMVPFADTEKVAYIKIAAEMGLGTLDLSSVSIREDYL